jgi:hypothetical protein
VAPPPAPRLSPAPEQRRRDAVHNVYAMRLEVRCLGSVCDATREPDDAWRATPLRQERQCRSQAKAKAVVRQRVRHAAPTTRMRKRQSVRVMSQGPAAVTSGCRAEALLGQRLLARQGRANARHRIPKDGTNHASIEHPGHSRHAGRLRAMSPEQRANP